MSARNFCEQEKVPLGQFYTWRSKLRAAAERKDRGFTPVRVHPTEEPAVSAGGTIELVLGNGRVLRVTGAVDVRALQAVIVAAERRAPC